MAYENNPQNANMEPANAADTGEEFIPKATMINRLAEKDRKHANELAALKAQMQSTQMANSAASNVINASNNILQQNSGDPMQQQPAQQPMQQQAQPQQQPMQPQQPQSGTMQMTPEQLDAVRKQAQQELVDKATQKQQEQDQAQQQAAHQQMQDQLLQEKQGIAKKIDDSAKEDPELADAVSQAQKNPAVAHQAISLLIGNDDAPEIFKKLMNNPEHYSAFTSPTSNPVSQARLLNNIGKEVALESQGSPQKVQPANFATSGAGSQKSLDNMNSAELRQYYKSKNKY